MAAGAESSSSSPRPGGRGAQAETRDAHGDRLAAALDHNAWTSDITGALTVQVLLQFLQLIERLEELVLQPDMPDSFIWRWSPSGQYSAWTGSFVGYERTLEDEAPKQMLFLHLAGVLASGLKLQIKELSFSVV
jgi:hypothetical protein